MLLSQGTAGSFAYLENLANNIASIPLGAAVAIMRHNDIDSAVAMTLLRMYGYNAWILPVGVCGLRGTSSTAVSSGLTARSQTVGGVITDQTTGTVSSTIYWTACQPRLGLRLLSYFAINFIFAEASFHDVFRAPPQLLSFYVLISKIFLPLVLFSIKAGNNLQQFIMYLMNYRIIT
jgi:hypothetical protein